VTAKASETGRRFHIRDALVRKGTETVTNGQPITLTAGTVSYTSNNVNQLTTSGYAYDADGNMTSFKTPDGYAATATYDAENRLSTVTYTDSNNIQHNYSFTYDADGLIAKQVIDGVETRFVRAGYLILQERDASNNVTRSYVWDGISPGGPFDFAQGRRWRVA